ncbi:MAG: WYL domain-containing protein [Actinobacteria bacterium]|nr:WYL domain-containing protein [Actinomycetota bacterium]
MSTTPQASDRLARLLALVPWVASHRDGVDVDEVCDRFGMTRAELERDLDSIMMVGVAPFDPGTMIDAGIEDDTVRIDFRYGFTRPLRLTPIEAATLTVAAAAAARIPGADASGPLQRAITKLAVATGDTGPAPVEVDLGEVSRDVFTHLDRARRTKCQIEIDYPDADGEHPIRRAIEPAQLFSAQGNWYVSSWCHHAGGARVFRLDRILATYPTERPFSAPAPEDSGISIDSDRPCVVVEIDRAFAWMAEPVPVREREVLDEVIRLRVAVGSSAWLARWLVQMGPAARIVEADPGIDADALVETEARRIRERYEETDATVR